MDAFDANAIIDAANDHPFGGRIRKTLDMDERGVGSVLLIPEVFSKPMRSGADAEHEELIVLLDHITLLPLDLRTARLAVHLATAVQAGADRFITNNGRDFPQTIEEIDIVYPDQL